jgi:peptide/nickel transport system substrate-binding protein
VSQKGALAATFSCVVVGALLLAVCIAGPVAAASSGAHRGGVVKGGTVTWAEPPTEVPTFIYPFTPTNFYSSANVGQLQEMMYRPLFWLGLGKHPAIDITLSLADPPKLSYTEDTVTIKLKRYKWSNGEKLNTRDVMQWLNILHAEKDMWPPYVPHIGIPDDILSVKVKSRSTLVIRLPGPVNGIWFTEDMLSQITPLPEAWDITHVGADPGSGGCGAGKYGAPSTDAACRAVWTFMAGQAGYVPSIQAPGRASAAVYASYATNPLWHVVDGPWRLTAFEPDGEATFVPNRHYSGHSKAKIDKFVEEPFASQSAEVNALTSGQLTAGYVPLQDIPSPRTKKRGQKVNQAAHGPNDPLLTGRFNLVPFYSWSINYFPYNFNSTGDDGNAGKIFRQLYFRQAFQALIDQKKNIETVDRGYGATTHGPAPRKAPGPYRPSRTEAIHLLKSHGWTIVPKGVDTCMRPGSGPRQCGQGIPAGAKLDFDLQYASGLTTLAQRMAVEQSSWASAGIEVNLSQADVGTVMRDAAACQVGPSCTWELENWGTGTTFAPEYYPTGETLFSTGAKGNYGSYSDPVNDNLTEQTQYTIIGFYYYQRHLSRQLPVVFQDRPATYLWEVNKKLRGVVPLNPFGIATPEHFYFAK